MARIKGTTVKLQVADASASPSDFVTLGGQRSCQFGGGSNVADTTDKDNDGQQTGEVTTINTNVQCSGQTETSDTAYSTIRTAFLNRTSVELKLLDNTAGTAYWLGTYQVSDFQETADFGDVKSYQISFVNNLGDCQYVSA